MDSLPKLYLFSISYSLHSTSFDQREVATVEHRPLRCTIVKGSRAGLPPAQRMIFKALIHLFELAASKFSRSKATYQTIRLYSKMISIEANAELIAYFWMHSQTSGMLGVQLHSHLDKTAQTTPALALDRR
jgi:hypothetical protein